MPCASDGKYKRGYTQCHHNLIPQLLRVTPKPRGESIIEEKHLHTPTYLQIPFYKTYGLYQCLVWTQQRIIKTHKSYKRS